MDYDDYFNPSFENDLEQTNKSNRKSLLETTKQMDKGYCKILKWGQRPDGKLKKIGLDVYTTGDIGSNIRDAETGSFYPEKVGTLDEHLFYKVILATGDCNARNGSSTLFYISPRHYMSHMSCDVDPTIIAEWEVKRDMRMKEKESAKQKRQFQQYEEAYQN